MTFSNMTFLLKNKTDGLLPLLCTDGYKLDHRRQYPEGTTEVFSNLTARFSRRGLDKTIFLGMGNLIDALEAVWDEFFTCDINACAEAYQEFVKNYLGLPDFDVTHIRQLHSLGYLPLHILSLPEGSNVPIGVPSVVIYNTHPDFYWLTNYVESFISCLLWVPCTSATTAYQFKKLLLEYAEKTGVDEGFVDQQCHDFSYRGMSDAFGTFHSSLGHLACFKGSDTLLSAYGFTSRLTSPFFSVPATEHSVMCAGTEKGELETIKRLITEIYPEGYISIVSDTWDFWRVISEYAYELRDVIMARNGKVIFRPDSGDPADIICGTSIQSKAESGAVQVLWDIFGGTINEKGFKVLDPHVGLIYGDGITLDNAKDICERLMEKGFASSNITFGLGSYTYQYVTRDTDGYAIKATNVVINGESIAIQKNPRTDTTQMKKSAVGYLAVYNGEDGEYFLKQNATKYEVVNCSFETSYLNGGAACESKLEHIRNDINLNLMHDSLYKSK